MTVEPTLTVPSFFSMTFDGFILLDRFGVGLGSALHALRHHRGGDHKDDHQYQHDVDHRRMVHFDIGCRGGGLCVRMVEVHSHVLLPFPMLAGALWGLLARGLTLHTGKNSSMKVSTRAA